MSKNTNLIKKEKRDELNHPAISSLDDESTYRALKRPNKPATPLRLRRVAAATGRAELLRLLLPRRALVLDAAALREAGAAEADFLRLLDLATADFLLLAGRADLETVRRAGLREERIAIF
jgi:hypothetical protein